MTGFDSFGISLIALALSLMTVSPLHLIIARAKPKFTPTTANAEDRVVGPPALDRRAADRLAGELLRGEPLYASIAQIARIYDQA